MEAYRDRPGEDTLLALLEAHQDSVYNVCYQVLRRPEDAQDAAQQVLMSLLDALPRIKDGAHLKQWLHRAAFHVSLDLKKVLKRRREREARVAPMAESPLPDEVVDAVQAHVSRLQDELRTLVVEHYFEQKPLAELAGERGCSTVAVWKKLERAREQLRDSLSRAGYATALDPFFASLKPVAAPKGLLSKVILTKAATAAVVTGTALKLKLIAAAAVVLGAAGALSYAVIRQREERRLEIELQEARAKARPIVAATAKTPVASSAAPKAVATPPPAVPELEEVEIFKTQKEFEEAFRKAVAIKDDAARWKTLRRIGFLRTPEQLRKAELEMRSRVGSSDYEKAFIGAVFKDWLESDLKGVIDFMMRFPSDEVVTKEKKLARTLMGLMTWKRDVVLEYARSLKEEDGRSEVLKELGVFMPPKPEAVLAMAPGSDRTGSLQRLLFDWGGRDPRAAALWIEQLSSAEERGEARSSLVKGWAKVDFRAAAAWVNEVATGDARINLLRDIVGMAWRVDPKGAFELGLTCFEGKLLWNLEMEHAFRAWGDADPAGALRWLQGRSDPETRQQRSFSLGSLGKLWAMRDPSAAIEWADTLQGEERTAVLGEIATGLVKSIISNPKEALSVIEKLPAAQRKRALAGVLDAWADIEPRAAADFARSQPESASLTELVAVRWAGRDLDAALAWAKGLPEGLDRDTALQVVAVAMAPRDIARALDLTKEIRDPGQRDMALEFVSKELSWKDLERAIALTWEIGNGTRRNNAQCFILGNRARQDPEACLRLLNRMTDAGRPEYGSFAQSYSNGDPRAATIWANGLTKPELREWTLSYTFPQWARIDRDAAQAWVTQATLPETLRQKLLKGLPNRP